MKKVAVLLLFVSTLISCSQDITFNNVAAFQGVKDNEGWKAEDAAASRSLNALLTIKAVTFNETMTLTMPVPGAFIVQENVNGHMTYTLGSSEARKATYTRISEDGDVFYQTGDGQIIVTDYDGATISGKFHFNAINTNSLSTAPHTVSVQSGVFYKVPVTQ